MPCPPPFGRGFVVVGNSKTLKISHIYEGLVELKYPPTPFYQVICGASLPATVVIVVNAYAREYMQLCVCSYMCV